MLSTNIGRLRILGYLEGLSYLVLLGICMPLKYWAEIPGPTYYAGMAHGMLFIAYCMWIVIAAFEHKWRLSKIALAFIASLLPFGPFVADAKLFNQK